MEEKVQYTLLLTNSLKGAVDVIVEPWVERFTLRRGHNLRVVAEGPKSHQLLQIEYREKAIVLYAWTGSSIEVQEVKA